MTELEKHRKIWQGKSDEWLFERLALELKDKVETIHNLLAENEQLRIANVVGRGEQLPCDCSKYPTYFDEEQKPRCKNCNERSWLAR